MKRVIAFSISLILCITMFGIFPALAAETEVPPEEQQETALAQELELVFLLQILDRETLDLQAVPTRGEAVAAILKAANLPGTSESPQYFVDVPPEHPYAKEINMAVQNGFISTDTFFFPDDPATLEQVVKMLTIVCGYEIVAQERGGYPSGYMAVASECDMLDGVPAELTNRSFVQLLYNALNTEIMNQEVFGEQDRYAVQEEYTLLNHVHEIYRFKGVVTDYKQEAIRYSGERPDGRITIGGLVFETGQTEIPACLEYEVEIYYHLEDETGEVLLLYPTARNQSIVVSKEDTISFENNRLKWYEGEKERSYGISPQAEVILNGVYAAAYTAEDFCDGYGSIELIDREGNGTADAVKLFDYQTAIVQAVDAERSVVYDKYKGSSFELNPEDKIIHITNSEGVSVSLEELKAKDVLLIAESKDKEVYNIWVSRKVISGTVTGKGEEEHPWVKIGEKRYRVSPETADKIQMGAELAFYLDVNDQIVDISSDGADAQNIVYFVASSTEPVFSDYTVTLKVFTSDGKMEQYQLKDKVVFDGETLTANEAGKALNNERQALVVEINSENKISKIDTKATGDKENPDTALIETQPLSTIATLRYKKASKSFSNKMIVDDEAVFFLVPPEKEKHEDELYEIIGTNYFNNDQYYAIGSYNVGINRGMSDVVVVELLEEEKISDDTALFLVNDITSELDADGSIRTKMSGYRESQEVSYFIEEEDLFFRTEGYTPARGDLLKIALSSKNEIKAIEPVYTVTDQRYWLSANPSYESFDGLFRVVNGYVYLKTDEIAKITIDDPLNGEISSSAFQELYNLDKFKIYRCVKEADSQDVQYIERVTANEVLDYIHNGANRSHVILHTRYAEAKIMVIYEE